MFGRARLSEIQRQFDLTDPDEVGRVIFEHKGYMESGGGLVYSPGRGYDTADPSPGVAKLREMERPGREAIRAEQQRQQEAYAAELKWRRGEMSAMVDGARSTQQAEAGKEEQDIIDQARKRHFNNACEGMELLIGDQEWDLESLRQSTEQKMRAALDKMSEA